MHVSFLLFIFHTEYNIIASLHKSVINIMHLKY